MNSGLYTLKSFLNDHNLEQLIVPEIQRDYVWRAENVRKLLESIVADSQRDIQSEVVSSHDAIQSLSPELRDILYRQIQLRKQTTNIGFIYAYHHDLEYPGRYLLIDGQQRMTTLFLVLLRLHIMENKQDLFRRSYFKNKIPKFDYKVRESAHSFLIEFLDFLLNGGDIKTIKNQYWYSFDYDRDNTIATIIANYLQIVTFFEVNALTLDYLENSTEFLFFDTNKTAQGEELYLYMNSRGVPVSNNENIKAQLLEGLTDLEKIFWGKKWEHWQSVFWKYRGKRDNADDGFDEFLRWILMINCVLGNVNATATKLSNELREIKESKKFGLGNLDKAEISLYMDALERLVNADFDTFTFPEGWLSVPTNVLDYVRILPIMLFAKSYQNIADIEIQRFAYFFFNVLKFDNVNKTPYTSTALALRLTSWLIDQESSDIADIYLLDSEQEFKNILTKEESAKLKYYKDIEAVEKRQFAEELFWEAENHRFLYGSINLICSAINQPVSNLNVDFDLEKFKSYLILYKQLFNAPDDLVRRALLTKGDYSIYDGETPSLNGERWSFLINLSEWRHAMVDHATSAIVVTLIQDCFQRSKAKSVPSALADIIQDFLDNASSEVQVTWQYHFVKNPKILEYCNAKMVCFVSAAVDQIYLLYNKHAHTNNFTSLRHYVSN